jgi:hypothetical protein
VTRVGASVVVLAAALLLAGCGGGSSGSSAPQKYTRAKTRACLVDKHVRVGGPLEFVASTATGGSLQAHLADNFVTIAFGLTVGDANNISQAYVHFHARNVGIGDVLRQQGNAVMLWHSHPSNTDAKLIQDCLK